ncbi:AAA family ATPase [Sorangium sp. So ce1099]|uniref:AAA family ATPase n=1 Tax=Sorangium sp. So ce1099 TaxID=3133331 RepID=UPI003F6348EB
MAEEQATKLSMILRPELALHGYDVVNAEWPRIGPEESYVRDDVFPRAHAALQRVRIQADPREAGLEAIRAAKNLLTSYEQSHTSEWFRRTPPDVVKTALLDLLYGSTPLQKRAEEFLDKAAVRKIDKGKSGVNVTTATYLLCMADPTKYAFAKPDRAFHPAFKLLCTRAGQPYPDVDGAARVVYAAQMYGELRALWERERGFKGDLLDVHTFLFTLAPQGGVKSGWARAMTPEIVAELVREYEVADPDLYAGLESAAETVRGYVNSSSRDPLEPLTLDRYAMGMGTASFCWAVEHGTKDYIPISLRNASAHEVVWSSRNGSWHIGRTEGFSTEKAQHHYEQAVLPRLQELFAAAKAFVERRPPPALVSPKLAGFRGLDAKTFCLFVAALDLETARMRLAGVTKGTRLATLASLLGAAEIRIDSFKDYVAAQQALAAAAERVKGLSAQGLTKWSYHDPRGELIVALLEDAAEEEPDSAEDEVDDVEPTAKVETATEPVMSPVAEWDSLVAGLDPDLVTVVRLLRTRWNVVLYGPPGTGKTYSSIQLAKAWRQWQGDDGIEPTVEQVTFHPSYGYEDFVEAFRPRAKDGSRFTLRDGMLPVLAGRAVKNPHRKYLLLIDELNRGDVARILGELITLLEADKRKPEHARRRMLSGKPLWMPANLYVLGTMNTADKSVSLMDVAVRRRFAFVHTPPRPDLLHAGRGLVEQVAGTVRLSDVLGALNQRLLHIGVLPDRLLGHALLWIEKAKVDDEVAEVAERFRRDIVPLVEEYCFSDRAQIARVLGKLVDRHGRPDDAVLDSPDAFVKALEALVSGDEPA